MDELPIHSKMQSYLTDRNWRKLVMISNEDTGEGKRNMIEIVPYDDRWPEDFEALAKPLREALGKHAVGVDHIGSTAVPGLVAKDKVDIQVTVWKERT